MTNSETGTLEPKQSKGKTVTIIVAGTIGNALEWYDLFIYGYLAVIIGEVFFPTHDQVTSVLLAFGTFGASYLMRPIGAAILGSYADRFGRKAGMTMTIWLMGIGTAIMAFTPGYQSIGVWATILVVLGKFIQGFSAGGEFGSSIAFLIESAPKKHRTLFGSGEFVGIGIATAMASIFGVVLNTFFTRAEIHAWAWRIPFIFGLLIVPLGVWIRHYVSETPAFTATAHQAVKAAPVTHIFKSAKGLILLCIGLYSLSGSANYLLHAYMPTYAKLQLHIAPTIAFWGALGFSIVQIIGTPLLGMVCDRWGKLKFIISGIVLLSVLSYPAFRLIISYPTPVVYICTIVFMAMLVTLATGPIPTFLTEQIPQEIRTTGLGLVHNLTFTFFGGFAPFVSVWLIKETGDKFVPAYYVILTGILALASGIVFAGMVLRAQKKGYTPSSGSTNGFSVDATQRVSRV
jgi:MHS family proline/betaine transporter-like MFS transporter